MRSEGVKAAARRGLSAAEGLKAAARVLARVNPVTLAFASITDLALLLDKAFPRDLRGTYKRPCKVYDDDPDGCERDCGRRCDQITWADETGMGAQWVCPVDCPK